MKKHYIYFLSILVLLFIAFIIPYQINDIPFEINDFGDGTRGVRRGVYDRVFLKAFGLPTLIASILLLIRYRFTAVIGTCIYAFSFAAACVMNYTIYFNLKADNIGPGLLAIFITLLLAVIFSLIQTIKLFTSRHLINNSDNQDLIDN